MRSKVFLAGLFVGLILAVSGANNYLSEAPDFLKACQLRGSNFEKCFSTTFQNIIKNWKNGVPGRKDIGSLDPFHVKKIKIAQNMENVANIQAELTNLYSHGLSNAIVQKSSINPKDYTIKLEVQMPKMLIESDYALKGRILLLNLDGHGAVKVDISDASFLLLIKTQLIQIENERFFDITSIKSHIRSIGGLHVNFDNLFNGNKELGDSTNLLFNDNWRDFFEIMRPAISEANDIVMFDRFKKIFRYIPAKYFINDLP